MYWGKQEESAILAALGYGGCGGDVPGDARWWVGDAEAACAVAMVPRRRRLPLLFWALLQFGGREPLFFLFFWIGLEQIIVGRACGRAIVYLLWANNSLSLTQSAVTWAKRRYPLASIRSHRFT